MPGLWPEMTFDDGHISNFEFALPILQSRAISAWFFITVGWTGRRPGYMGWKELRKLHQAGQVIGAHGWAHTLLTHCSARRLHRNSSMPDLRSKTNSGPPSRACLSPAAATTGMSSTACQQAGYTQIFTSIPRAEPSPTCADHWSAECPRRHDTGVDRQTLPTREPCFIRSGAAIPHARRPRSRCLGDRLYEKLWAIFNRKEPNTDAGRSCRT